MAETPIPITTGSGQASIASDLVSGNQYQQIKVVDGTLGSLTPLKINADGSITASIYGNITTTAGPASVSGTVGASVIGLPPVNVTQFAGSPAGILLPINDSVSASTNNGLAVVNFPYLFNGGTYDRWRGNSSVGALVTTGASSVAVVIIGGSILTSSTANQSVSGTIGASIIGITPVNLVSANGVTVIGTGSNGNDSLTSVLGLNTATFNYVFNGTSWDMQRGNKTIGTLVTPYQFPSSLVSGVTSVITGTASVQVLAPAAASQRNYITNVLVTNAAAVGTTVQLFDGGNVIYAGYAAASGGGFAVSFPSPLKQSSIAGNLSALSTVQASVFVSASGYTAA